MIDLDPGEQTTWDDLLLFAQLHRTASDRLAERRDPLAPLVGQQQELPPLTDTS